MIIKSLGRKASAKLSGGGQGRNPFSALVRYMTRDSAEEQSQSVLWHGFYGHPGMPEAEIVHAFEDNARRLKERKNGNVLYHEILSFSAGYRLQDEALAQAVADVGEEYLRYRAANQLAFGAIHFDTEHIHLHLMISANEVGKHERVRLAKAEFAAIQKATEAYVLARYPELAQTRIYDRDRSRERLKTDVHEQAMKARTGTPSRKEAIKAKLHGLFERATSLEDLGRLLLVEGLTFYTRGKSRGVVERLPDGSERRHRFATLGLDAHYSALEARIGTRETSRPSHEQEARMVNPESSQEEPIRQELNSSTVKVAERELFTGELDPAWHSQDAAEPEPKTRYTDDVLKKAHEKSVSRQAETPGKGKDETPER